MVTGTSGGYNIDAGRAENNCWRRRTRTEKCLTVWCMFTLILLLLFMILYFLLITNIYNPLGLIVTDPAKLKCLNKTCEETGTKLMSYMDSSVDPCNDFYSYACNGYRATHAHEKSAIMDMTKWVDQQLIDLLELHVTSAQSEEDKKIKKFYSSCKDVQKIKSEGEQPVLDLMKHEKLMMYDETTWKITDYDVTDDVIKLLKLYGSELFELVINVDFKNSSNFITAITPCQDTTSLHESQTDTNPSVPDATAEADVTTNITSTTTNGNTTTSVNVTTNVNDTTTNGNTTASVNVTTSTTTPAPTITEEFIDHIHNNMSIQEIYAIYKESEQNKTLRTISEFTKGFFSGKNLTDETLNGIKEFIKELDSMRPSIQECNSPEQILNSSKDYTVQQLDAAVPKIKWNKLLNATLGREPGPQEKIRVQHHEFLVKLQSLLDKSKPRDVHNSLVAMFVSKKLQPLTVVSALEKRCDTCIKYTKMLFPEVLSKLYVQRSTELFLKLKIQVKKLQEYVKMPMMDRIRGSDWLDQSSIDKLILKLENINVVIGAPDESFYRQKLLNVEIGDNFVTNVVEMYKHAARYEYSASAMPNRYHTWRHIIYPVYPAAEYFPQFNALDVTLAMLNRPFYNQYLPNYINFGAIGMSICHEMAHAITGIGLQFDENGKFNESQFLNIQDFIKQKQKCFEETYSSMSENVTYKSNLVDYNVAVDGEATLNENIADVVAIKYAYEGYVDWLNEAIKLNSSFLVNGKEKYLDKFFEVSSHKMFFLSAAQVYCSDLSPIDHILRTYVGTHTTDRQRVNGMMQNSEDFATAYQCARGSPMNPLRKCSFV